MAFRLSLAELRLRPGLEIGQHCPDPGDIVRRGLELRLTVTIGGVAAMVGQRHHIEPLQQADLPGRGLDAAEPGPRLDLAKREGIEAEAVAGPGTAQLAVPSPDVVEDERRRALVALGRRAPFAVLDQLLGYAFKKFARSTMKASACSRSQGSFL
jgi:hypothetical protein